MTRKILIIGPAWVGDMVMAQSLFKFLHEQDSDIMIDVLAPAWTLPLLGRMPEVNRSFNLPFSHGELHLRKRYQFGKALRSFNYDQAIVLPNSFKSALIPWFAKIPKRTGWIGEFRYPLLNDIRQLNKNHYPLMIERYLALGLKKSEPLPPYVHPSFYITQQSQTNALNRYQLNVEKPVLALCAGAAFGNAKCWPPEYFAVVANKKLEEGWAVWLFGSQNDRIITNHIMILTKNGCENLAGRVDLTDTIDLLSMVTGVVTNDSGLMHVAAALNKPMVALYGPTSPSFTPPLSANATILQLKLSCQPCYKRICPLKHHRCMRDLTPDWILTIIKNWGGVDACSFN